MKGKFHWKKKGPIAAQPNTSPPKKVRSAQRDAHRPLEKKACEGDAENFQHEFAATGAQTEGRGESLARIAEPI